jgi:hypothetical protein
MPAAEPEIDCAYRHTVRRLGDREVACCGLLERITGATGGSWCDVDRDACEVCCDSFPSSSAQLNPVIPSLLFSVCDSILSEPGAAGLDAQKLQGLREWATQQFHRTTRPHPHRTSSYACDVVIWCAGEPEAIARAIESVLNQQNVYPILHLAHAGGVGADVARRFADRSNVTTHHCHPATNGLWGALHDLVPNLRTDFVAVQDATTASRPMRLAYAVQSLDEHGGEILAAGIRGPDRTVLPSAPGPIYRRSVPPQTLVFRRASLIDMGGFADRDADADAELVYRAFCEDRKILLSRLATVDLPYEWQPGTVGPAPDYGPGECLRRHGRGFAMRAVECDVVLPFHGQLDFVGQALESVLQQQGTSVVVHLVDDASPEDASGFLQKWKTHPQVRTYHNARNIGQFASFNNVIPCLETELVAIQDADDISLPNRLHQAGNLLRLSQADVFGSACETFGDASVVQPARNDASQTTVAPRERFVYSVYPSSAYGVGYFVHNPSVVMRAASFASVGGFADFGNVLLNRASVDTEFYIRAYYSGLRFSISRDVHLKYRCHTGSATQNVLTGFGTPARMAAHLECQRRAAFYRRGAFDARAFGGLENYRGVTERL